MNTKLQMALSSYRQLRQQLPLLTDKELHECLQFEYETRRRKHTVNALIATLAERNRQTFISLLKEKLNGSRLRNPVQS